MVLLESIELSISDDHDDVYGALVRYFSTLLLEGLQAPVFVEADVDWGALGLHTFDSGDGALEALKLLGSAFFTSNCVFGHIMLII